MVHQYCYKCGRPIKGSEITIEHIPPKCLVARPDHSRLIKVSSCSACNMGRSKDDENFRNWLIPGVASSSQDAKEIYDTKVLKSWDRRPAVKFGLRQKLQKSDLYTPSGIYLGKITYANIEEKRAVPVIDSIAKGILWHHFNSLKSKFPFGVKPEVFHNPHLDNDWIRFFLNITVPEVLVPNVFEYRFGYLPVEDGGLFHVFCIFYNRELFYVQYLVEKTAN